MNTLNRLKPRPIKTFIPPWNMPSDPVKAVVWFLHWFLRILVHFFWLPIAAMMIYELVANWLTGGPWNGIVSGLITLFVGVLIWGILYAIALAANVAGKISQTISDVSRLQQMPGMYGLDDLFRTSNAQESEQWQDPQGTRVVEGTITDLDEERRKRRYE